MENNTPQGQPSRQPVIVGPKIAVAHVDPCIIYLEVAEASSANEVPALIACWARSSSEVQKTGDKAHLKLNHVFVIMGSSLPIHEGSTMPRGKPVWHFTVDEQEELTVESDAARAEIGSPLFVHFPNTRIRGSRSEIKFIDQDTDLSLERFFFNKTHSDYDFAKKILAIASVKWPSLSAAKAFLDQNPSPDVGAYLNKNSGRSQTEVDVQAEPNEGVLIYNCGEGLYKTGQYKLALETLQLAIKQPSVRYQALNLMGLSFLKRGMPDFAVNLLARAASELPIMDELKKEIVYSLGLAYEASKRPDKSLKQWKRIYEVDMDYRDVSKRVEESYGGSDEQAA
jgi:hypothetical protein